MATLNMLRTHKGKKVFSKKKIRFVTTLDLIKCLKHIKDHDLNWYYWALAVSTFKLLIIFLRQLHVFHHSVGEYKAENTSTEFLFGDIKSIEQDCGSDWILTRIRPSRKNWIRIRPSKKNPDPDHT